MRPIPLLILSLVLFITPAAYSQEDTLGTNKVWKNLTPAELSLMADFVERVAPEQGVSLNADDREVLQTLSAGNDRLILSFVKKVREFYGGALTPTEVGPDIRFLKKTLTEEKIRKLLADSNGAIDAFVALIEPRFFEYKSHLQIWNRLRELDRQNRWGSLNLKKTLRLGTKDDSVLRVKNRLVDFGYKISSLDTVFDQDMLSAVNDIQLQLKKKPDGAISRGGSTQKYLELPLKKRIAQVLADLEKTRWLPQENLDRFIFVNLAFSYFLLIDKNQPNPVVFNFKAINGRVARKTPSIVDRISEVVLNPFWTVPDTILVEDKAPLLRKMNARQIRAFFAKYHYVLYDREYRKQIDPTTVRWSRVTKDNLQIRMRQRPNYSSALGVVRFPMGNKEFIYLHDTGERNLFAESNRLLSSGCMRLEKPIDVAEYLLAGTEWTRAAIENFVSKPGEVKADETDIPMKTGIRVYTLPITSHLASDGVMRFSDDVYGHNAAIGRMTYASAE